MHESLEFVAKFSYIRNDLLVSFCFFSSSHISSETGTRKKQSIGRAIRIIFYQNPNRLGLIPHRLIYRHGMSSASGEPIHLVDAIFNDHKDIRAFYQVRR